MADMPTDPVAVLAQDLLDLTARLGARGDQDPFGNPVLLVALAISRRMDAGGLDDAAIAGLIRHLRDAAFADRAHRVAAYVGGVEHGGEPGCAARPRPAPAAARPERQPRALGGIPCFGGTPALRRGVHRASHLRPALSGRKGARRGRLRPHLTRLCLTPPAAHHPGRGIRTGRRRHRPRPRRDRPFQRRIAVRRPVRLAGPLDRAEPAARHPVHLGRLRHRRTHRYRLVGHVAAAAGHEAAAARPPARPTRRAGRTRPTAASRDRGDGRRGRAARRLSQRPGPAARL